MCNQPFLRLLEDEFHQYAFSHCRGFEHAENIGGNLRNILIQASYLTIFATAQMMVLVTRGFDPDLVRSLLPDGSEP